jgi:hypothetical protein
MFKKLRAELWLASVSRREDLEMFWSSGHLPLERLLGDQIIAILKIIDTELLVSFGFGLKISRKDVVKEKMAVLKILNSIGSLGTIADRFTFETSRNFVLECLYQAMADEAEYYFKKAKKGEVKNKYNCHLEAVVASILHSIYNPDGRIPYVGNLVKIK